MHWNSWDIARLAGAAPRHFCSRRCWRLPHLFLDVFAPQPNQRLAARSGLQQFERLSPHDAPLNLRQHHQKPLLVSCRSDTVAFTGFLVWRADADGFTEHAERRAEMVAPGETRDRLIRRVERHPYLNVFP